MRVGLRPEAVRLCAPGSGDMNVKVEFVEFLGDKTHVFLSLPSGERIVALAGASPGLPRERHGRRRVRPGRGACLRWAGPQHAQTGVAMTARSVVRDEASSGIAFVAPYLIVFLGLVAYPLFSGIWLSLHKADLFGGSEFIGTENYARLLRDGVSARRSGTPAISSFSPFRR